MGLDFIEIKMRQIQAVGQEKEEMNFLGRLYFVKENVMDIYLKNNSNLKKYMQIVYKNRDEISLQFTSNDIKATLTKESITPMKYMVEGRELDLGVKLINSSKKDGYLEFTYELYSQEVLVSTNTLIIEKI